MTFPDTQKQIRKLLNEASGQLGMIAEVKSKCLLLQMRLRRARKNQEFTEPLEEEATRSLRQMKKDIATYSCNLKRIYEELESFGIFLSSTR